MLSMRVAATCVLLCLAFFHTIAFSALSMSSGRSPLKGFKHRSIQESFHLSAAGFGGAGVAAGPDSCDSSSSTRLFATKPRGRVKTEVLANSAPATTSVFSSPLMENVKVGGIFALWFFLNANYNIANKQLLNMVPNLTYTVAWLQLFIGLFYVLPVWLLGLRAVPELTVDEVKKLLPVAITHTLTHLGAVVSMSAGAVSFTHIVKSAEPAVSALLSAVFMKSFLPLPVYLTLIPVMGGVAMASLKELSFTWLSFGAAMISNVASASRGIVGKLSLGKNKVGKNMNAANLYAVMTIMSAAIVLPIALALEGGQVQSTVQTLVDAGRGTELLSKVFQAGFLYYLYNEVAFLALDNVAPVTHALGNTVKRVIIIISSCVAFSTPMSQQGMVGSAVTMAGVLLYSLAKNHFQ